MMEQQLPGAIVNVSSLSARFGNVGQVNYVASKAGVEGLTRTVCREMAKFDIRCNAVMPGLIDTPMIETIPEGVVDFLIMQIPLGRKGTPEDVANAVTFLASPMSDYISGAILPVTGGF